MGNPTYAVGNNKNLRLEMKAKISEIFKSIQGEGIYQGAEQVFVRFYGCNLKCAFCDTDLTFFRQMSAAQVLATVHGYKDYHSVSFTGGEPLLQVSFLRDLAVQLKKENNTLYLETNGTLPENLKNIVEYIDIVAMDFKLPSSSGQKDCWPEHTEFLQIAADKNIFIKAIITSSTNSEDIFKAIKIIKKVRPATSLVLQPGHPYENELEYKLSLFRNICKQQGINTLVLTQLHKDIGVK